MKQTVSVQNLSKCFKLYAGPRDRIKEWLHPFRKEYHRKFWALRNITFSITEGETLGIIGQNGSGKSTLLQILTKVMTQSSGTVEVEGRVSALLELGTGFNMELTGRQNLYLSGSIMGLSKDEVADRIPMIEEFAKIGDFIDQPVKLYSSGMFVRLAFAAAIHVDPDILIVDEALAVGDIKFQNKCYRKFTEFKEKGKTIIFVTHSTDLVAKHCDRALLLHQGELKMDGEPNEVINRYLELLLGNEDDNKPLSAKASPAKSTDIKTDNFSHKISQQPQEAVSSFLSDKNLTDICRYNPLYNPNEHRYGSQKGRVIDFLIIVDDQTVNPLMINAHSRVDVYVKYVFFQRVEVPIFGFTLKTLDGVEVLGSNSFYEKMTIKSKDDQDIAIVKFTLPVDLVTGEYFVSLGLAEFDNNDTPPIDRRYDIVHLKINNSTRRYGLVDLNMKIEQLH